MADRTSVQQQQHPRETREQAGDAFRTAAMTTGKQAKSKSPENEDRRRSHKPETVTDAASADGHFSPVGNAVEEGERADHDGDGPGRQSNRRRHQHAYNHDRRRNQLIEPRDGQRRRAQERAHDQQREESQRDHPTRTSTRLHRPPPDGRHREEVIPPGEWMREPGAEIPGEFMPIMTRMRVRDRGENKSQRTDKEATTAGLHAIAKARGMPAPGKSGRLDTTANDSMPERAATPSSDANMKNAGPGRDGV